MKILFVRPLISQVNALLDVSQSVYALLVWDQYQDPCLTVEAVKNFPEIPILEWREGLPGRSSFYRKVRYLVDVMKRFQFDVIHLNGLRDLPAFYLSRLFTDCKPKIVTTSRNPQIWSNENKIGIQIRLIRILADGYVSISSKNFLQMTCAGFPKKRIRFIPNAFYFSDGAIGEEPPAEKGKIRIVYVASVDRRKSQMSLVDAIGKISRNYPNLEVLLIGSTRDDAEYVQELGKRINHLHLCDVVKMVGRIRHEEVMGYYHTADLVVFPSTMEMMPRAVIEAMWLGKPVIASAVDGILDLITDQETGLLVAPERPAELASAICRLIDDPVLAASLGAAGQKYIQQFCSPGQVGRQYVDFYRELIGK